MADKLPYSKAESWKMFNRIAKRYDFLNRFLSFGLDISWRKKINQFLPPEPQLEILDLATGTGDVLLYLCAKNQNIKMAYGIDMAEGMLTIGQEKIVHQKLQDRIFLQPGDANRIPFDENRFDAVTMAFGIRNVENPSMVLREIYRVLRHDGRAIILEFSVPQNTFFAPFYMFYLRHIIPSLGAFISGDAIAYDYLNKTVQNFPHGEDFCKYMRDAGFCNVKANPLTFGSATIYQGGKV